MITKLWVKDFRNLDELVFEFPEKKPVVIVGENNQGKTNFLESLYVLGNGESPIGSPTEHLVSFSENEAILGMDFSSKENDYRFYVKLNKEGKRQGQLNEKDIRSFNTIKKLVHISFLSADIIRIFQESADYRRKDLDKFISTISDTYSETLKRYEKILKQKNRSLKKQEGLSMIPIWNKQLVEHANEIVKERQKAVKLIQEKLQKLLPEMIPELGEKIEVVYKFMRLETTDNYQESLLEKLEEDSEKELRVGYSLVGPQRDDFDIEIDEKPLYSIFSRGINRSMAILFKVVQLMIIEEEKGYFPMLLLDEPFAELDTQKKKELVPFITHKTQCVYTTIQKDDIQFFDNPLNYEMKNGNLKLWKN